MLKRWSKKIWVVLGTMPGLAGACLGLMLAGVTSENSNPLGGLPFGWLYGVAVGGLIRLFPVKPGAFPLVGLIAGPVPFLILFGSSSSLEDRGGAVLASGFLGLVIGLLEWGRVRRQGPVVPVE